MKMKLLKIKLRKNKKIKIFLNIANKYVKIYLNVV